MNKTRTCRSGKVWDLHIHSNQCSSTTDPALKSLSVEEYVRQIINVLEGCDDLEMISFTDHNHISVELYRAFYNEKSRIALLPGIEIDVSLEEGGAAKHLIVYFDAMGDMDLLEGLAGKLNRLLAERNVGSGNGKAPIYINTLLDELVGMGVHFALSPHAMKQGRRGIDYDWHPLPESEQSAESKKYLDQFFCFWESSGKSDIAHAVDYLRRMDRDELISVVSFSDSKDFAKLKEYLDNPRQYFNALPSFNGLKLAGSEITRITKKQDKVAPSDLGSYIGFVDFQGQHIEFSPRLNAIIGGRGSGKSVLLDSIANAIDPSMGNLHEERRSFIDGLPIDVRTMSDSSISAGRFRVDYFNQSYVAGLFNKSGKAFNEELEAYFSEPFSRIETIDTEGIRRDNSERFSRLVETLDDQIPENIVGFVEKFIVDTKDSLDMNIGSRKSRASVPDAKLVKYSYQSLIDDVHDAVLQRLPPTLAGNNRVKQALLDFERVICEEAHELRQAYFEGPFLQNTFVDLFIAKKKSLSDAQSARSNQIELFNQSFSHITLGMRRRVGLVRALIAMCDNFQTYYERHCYANGERENAFKFVRDLRVEHPIDFMVRKISECVKQDERFGSCSRDTLWDYLCSFCFSEDGYRKGESWETLFEKLKAFDLDYEESSSIRFNSGDGTFRDIKNLSPGTQTNILIEYIVHKETGVPLLIDQPEDNVDNQAIYNNIRRWFLGLKRARQVIVVTHDANIVINADAENVIIAEQKAPGHFIYDFGALEYGNIIDRASLILDGGKDAVKRRLVKYGE